MPTVPALRRHPAGRTLAAVLLSGVVLAGLLAAPAAAVTTLAGSPLPAPPERGPGDARAPVASTLLDADGEPFAYLFEQYRIAVTADRIAEEMKAAVVAIEDRRFFAHEGVDWAGVARALVANMARTGNPLDGQGASTITMQYVKNHRLYALADTEREREAAVADTLERKLADVALALRIEDELSKREILTRYLNVAYFGHGAYGVAAAARTYFGVAPSELTVPQAALLAGMLRAPGSYDPVEHPEAARERRNVVIDTMVETGSITRGQAAAASAAPLGVRDPLGGQDGGCLSADPDTAFFCAYTVAYLQRLGISPGELRTGGYTVRTTLDREATAAAAEAVARQVPVAGTDGIVNAMAVVEPGRQAHPVRALVANKDLGPDAAAGQTAFPVPTAPVPHGAGSVYKIFTAAAALEAGVVELDSTLPVPGSYTSEVYTNAGAPYTVQNPGDFPDELTLRQALALSPNTTFLALADRIGSVDPIVEMAQRLGLRRSLDLPAGPDRTVAEAVKAEERGSFTLGPTPTSPLELANVAATIAGGGVWCPPSPLVSVTDRDGTPVPLEQPACAQAVPEGLANTLAVGLSDDHLYGTAEAAAEAAGWNRPMIGKTGTTQVSISSAFVGATPQYAGAVMTWSDATPPRPICLTGGAPTLCGEGNLFGGSIPARTWYAAMTDLHEGLPVAELPAPDPAYVQDVADDRSAEPDGERDAGADGADEGED